MTNALSELKKRLENKAKMNDVHLDSPHGSAPVALGLTDLLAGVVTRNEAAVTSSLINLYKVEPTYLADLLTVSMSPTMRAQIQPHIGSIVARIRLANTPQRSGSPSVGLEDLIESLMSGDGQKVRTCMHELHTYDPTLLAKYIVEAMSLTIPSDGASPTNTGSEEPVDTGADDEKGDGGDVGGAMAPKPGPYVIEFTFRHRRHRVVFQEACEFGCHCEVMQSLWIEIHGEDSLGKERWTDVAIDGRSSEILGALIRTIVSDRAPATELAYKNQSFQNDVICLLGYAGGDGDDLDDLYCEMERQWLAAEANVIALQLIAEAVGAARDAEGSVIVEAVKRAMF